MKNTKTLKSTLKPEDGPQKLGSITKKWIGTQAPIEIPELIAQGCTRMEALTLQQLLKGFTNKEIAQRLGISEKGVKFHVTNIFKKLGAKNRTQLIVRFYAKALSSLPLGAHKLP